MAVAERMRVVIIGGGFAGLAAARSLARAPVGVTLSDRHQYHLFQPLVYQVATAALAPNTIAAPIRAILHRQANATVIMETVTGIDAAGWCSSERSGLVTTPSLSRRVPGTLISVMTNG